MNIDQFFILEHQIFKNIMLKTNVKIFEIINSDMEKSKISKIDKFILEFNNDFLKFINNNKSAFQCYNCSIDMQVKHLEVLMHYFEYKNQILSMH
jgi:hypothetical protein